MIKYKVIILLVTACMFALFRYTDHRAAEPSMVYEVRILKEKFPTLKSQIESLKNLDSKPTLSYLEYRKILWLIKINS